MIHDGSQVHQVQVDEAHLHQGPNEAFHQIFDPLRSHLPQLALFPCLPGKPFQRKANRHVGRSLQSVKPLGGDGVARGLRRKRQRCNGQHDRPGLAGLPSKFLGCTRPHASSEAGQQEDKFRFLEQLAGQGVQSSHALLSQRRQGSAPHAVKRMAEAEVVDVLARVETGFIGIDEDQVG